MKYTIDAIVAGNPNPRRVTTNSLEELKHSFIGQEVHLLHIVRATFLTEQDKAEFLQVLKSIPITFPKTNP